MIHPQVHLRIPCYDFYFLYSGQFAHLLGTTESHPERQPTGPIRRAHSLERSVVATGGVYKGQGRNQRELMTRAYWEFLVHGEQLQAPIPSTNGVQRVSQPSRVRRDAR